MSACAITATHVLMQQQHLTVAEAQPPQPRPEPVSQPILAPSQPGQGPVQEGPGQPEGPEQPADTAGQWYC